VASDGLGDLDALTATFNDERRAFDQWADPASQRTLTDLTRQVFAELRTAIAALD
jgi:hypothetical protein